jgi:hypothetical protein
LSGTAEDHVKPVVLILSHMNPVHTLSFNFCEIHFPRPIAICLSQSKTVVFNLEYAKTSYGVCKIGKKYFVINPE